MADDFGQAFMQQTGMLTAARHSLAAAKAGHHLITISGAIDAAGSAMRSGSKWETSF